MQQMATVLHRWMNRSGRSPFAQSTPPTLGHAVRQAARLLAPAAAEHRITVRISLSDAAASLPPGPAYTIVSNALRNSIQAIADGDRQDPPPPPNHQVEITAITTATYAELSVRDTGPGLPPSMFDTDARFRFGQTTKPNGHGIGLAFVQDTLYAIGGTLNIKNNPNRGTTLTARYPVATATPSDAPHKERVATRA